jgi:hypothetical protein
VLGAVAGFGDEVIRGHAPKVRVPGDSRVDDVLGALLEADAAGCTVAAGVKDRLGRDRALPDPIYPECDALLLDAGTSPQSLHADHFAPENRRIRRCLNWRLGHGTGAGKADLRQREERGEGNEEGEEDRARCPGV